MKVRYIPATVVLTAGLITSIICIMRDYEVLYSLELLFAVLLIFTIIGIVAQKIIIGQIMENKRQEAEKIQEERLKMIQAEYEASLEAQKEDSVQGEAEVSQQEASAETEDME